MITVTTWLWGEKYSGDYVAKLARGVKRHLQQNHRFVCMVDRPRHELDTVCEQWAMPKFSRELLNVKGCFARLALFDPEWQVKNGVGERIANIDLDAIVTGPLDPLFNRPENFVILQGANAKNPCPYNGSLFLLRPGAHQNVFADFSLEAAANIKFHEFPDDQGWFWEKIPNAAGWKAGLASGVYGFQKPGWPPDSDDLPKDSRLVAFFGWRDPSKFTQLDWVKEHWRAQ